ncbi:MAG: hypothetical protein WAS33_14305 [Candidatus Promineifilaceae bacterium]
MNQTNAQSIHLPRQAPYRNQLIGKVVLVIGNDTAVLQTLIIQLAQKGADIALFCRQLSAEAVRRIQAQVESLGQRFLLLTEKALLPAPDAYANPVKSLVDAVVSTLGQLDIFIDLSAQKGPPNLHNRQPEPKTVQPSWQMRQAIFAELAHA